VRVTAKRRWKRGGAQRSRWSGVQRDSQEWSRLTSGVRQSWPAQAAMGPSRALTNEAAERVGKCAGVSANQSLGELV
jgi:hypothetical protein